jgi:crotonobetainyl-CoA:carnitine CoA-transferase CaiB-like acyl-CoA transferase
MDYKGPLTGVRVVDFTHVLGGPYASMLLGDMGAEIIKIEPPGRGDSTRLSGPPFQEGESAYFICVNRNKKSICLDLKKKEGVEVAKRLVKDCDVVTSSFRPGVMRRLGLGYEELKKIRPDVIYGALSAFGREGPLKDKPGFELIIQGLTGLVSVTSEPGRRPGKIQIQVVDLCSGMFLALAILGALYHRKLTGEGQRVDTSLLESTSALLANLAGIYFMTGKVPVGMGTRNPQVMPSQALKTKDSYILVVTQPNHWGKFCTALGKPEWISDAPFSEPAYRVEHYDQTEKTVEEITTTKTTAEWMEIFDKHQVAATPINTVEEFFAEPQTKAVGLVETLTHPQTGPIQILKQPWNFSAAYGGVKSPPPRLGEHTEQVLKEAGLSPEEISSLKDQGVIFGS